MGTWLPGVPYTDPTPDQVTNQANTDRTEAADAAAGVDIDSLPTHPLIITTADTLKIPVSINGVTTQLDFRELMGLFFGVGNGRNIADDYAATSTDTSLIASKTTGINVSVPHVAFGSAQPPIWIVQTNSGQITVVAGTLSTVVVTGTGRAKTRAQYSAIYARYIFDFSGTSVWTVSGDAASS